MLRKLFSCLLALLVCALPLGARGEETEGARLTVIATLFPQYDFVRQLAGARAEVTLLLPPGVESHSYEPTPHDMLAIQSADLFIYTGDEMEPWAGRILEGIDTDALQVVNASEGVELLATAHDHEDAHASEHEEAHELDPHIWLDPTLAERMVENILTALVALDPAGADIYQANAAAYREQLAQLDRDMAEMVDSAKRREIIVADRFSYGYLTARYELDYLAAYDSCDSGAEPSVKTMLSLIREIGEKQIPAVYYKEMSNATVAQSLCEQTGAKMLLLHSVHNVSSEDLAEGVTYLSLMYQNLTNLREGLN